MAPNRIHSPPLPSSALIPAPGCTGLQTWHQHSLATRGTEECKAGEDSHSVKGSQRHLKRNSGFPQCRLRRMGGGVQLQLPSVLGTRKRPSAQPGLRAWCTQQPLAGRTRQQLLCLLGLCIKKWNSKACVCVCVGGRDTNDKPSAA